VTQRNPAPSLSSPRTAPSIHVRAALTWLAIFPLVAIGLTAMAPFTVGWDPVLPRVCADTGRGAAGRVLGRAPISGASSTGLVRSARGAA
jgi:hypothetical protein